MKEQRACLTLAKLMAVKEALAKEDEKNIIVVDGKRYYDIRCRMIEKGHIHQ